LQGLREAKTLEDKMTTDGAIGVLEELLEIPRLLRARMEEMADGRS
jgi:hypothetical protein